MLMDWNKVDKPEDEELEKRLETEREKLIKNQILVKERNLPVVVLFEGWGAAGKGSVLGRIIKNLDPRFFKTEVMKRPKEEERRYPFLYRHFAKIPQEGKFTYYCGGWMDEVTKDYLTKTIDKETYNQRIESIKRFERQLTDNGYLVLKFFLHIDKKEQKRRIDNLLADKNTKWHVDKEDIWENEHYERCLKVYDSYIRNTNQSTEPWYLINSENRKWAELQILEIMNRGLEIAIKNGTHGVPILQNSFPLKLIPKLSEVDLDKSITEEEYKKELEKYQKRLNELQNEVYRKKMSVIIAYEGWDAAGKGGNIKRVTAALDPRGYEVHPIASPEKHEKARHFLWRFWTRLPKSGHTAIFDRTWYGRVMVERIEGFCTKNDWQRAYNEINEFEKELDARGIVLIKFWVHIDKDTQKQRFEERMANPEKRWKITDEDWRNREKWDQYEEAIDEMLEKTNTEYAPWTILESNDKKYARIKALKTIIESIEAAMKK